MESGEKGFRGKERAFSFFGIFLRLLFLVCFVLLAVFAALTYQLLGGEEVHIVSPDKFFGQDFYRLRDGRVEIDALNETFLEFSASDPNEEQEKKKIKMMLEGNEFEIRNSFRRGSGYIRRTDHYVDIDGPRSTRVRPRHESWLLNLQSPRYLSHLPRFRQLLKAWVRNKKHDPRVMGELCETMKKPIDEFYRSLRESSNESVEQQPAEEPKRYKTCAVVGNSGILLNSRLGSFIDSHDMVIRLNNARVKGFEGSVGSKTTLSFVNSNIYHACSRRLKCFCHPYGNVPIVMYLCQSQHMMDIAFCEQHKNTPVLVTDPRFDNICARIVKWYSVKHYVESTGKSIHEWSKDHNGREFHYSSGFQAIMLSVGICEKVDILGFGKSSSAKHHYHSNQKGELDLHDYAAEYLFYDDLIRNKTSVIPFLNEAGIPLPRVKIYR